MPRGPVVFTLPPGTTPQSPGDVIQSAVWNAAMDDVAQTFNTIQPIEYGGTNSATASGARTNLGLGTSAVKNYTDSTWTPSLAFNGVSTGVTYSSRSGTYIKIGDLVVAWCTIVLTSKGSAVGQLGIGGLPETVRSGVTGPGSVGFISNINLVSGATGVKCSASGATNTVSFVYETTTGDGALDNTMVTNTTEIRITVTYPAAV